MAFEVDSSLHMCAYTNAETRWEVFSLNKKDRDWRDGSVLRTLGVPTEDLGSVLSIHIAALTSSQHPALSCGQALLHTSRSFKVQNQGEHRVCPALARV